MGQYRSLPLEWSTQDKCLGGSPKSNTLAYLARTSMVVKITKNNNWSDKVEIILRINVLAYYTKPWNHMRLIFKICPTS
jgi:hypothetical protein